MSATPARRSLVTGWRLLVLSIATVLSVGPLVYMVLVSFAENAYLLRNPLDILNGSISLANYKEVWADGEIPRYFLNSLIVATVTTFLVVLLGSMMAYALARFDFPGKGAVMALILLQLMVPVIMLLIPQFLLARELHLLNSRAGLILFYVGGNLAFITFLLVGFFRGIPRELDEAMHLDGAGSIRRYWSLILPLSRPALATGAIFAFLGAWDEYVWAVTIIDEPGLRTLPVGIAMFSGAHITNWGLTFAASVIALIPVVIVFLTFQRQFVSGITSGALKS